MTVGQPRAAGERTKQAIVEAAARLLDTHALHEVTVRRIAEEAGVQPSQVHRYFGKVDAVFQAVSDHVALQIRAEIDPSAGPEEMLFAAIDFYRRSPSIWLALLRGVAEQADMPSTLGQQSGFAAQVVLMVAERRGVGPDDAGVLADVGTALYLLAGELAIGSYAAGRGFPSSEDPDYRARLRAEVRRILAGDRAGAVPSA